MKKRLFAIILAAVMATFVLCFGACSSKPKGGNTAVEPDAPKPKPPIEVTDSSYDLVRGGQTEYTAVLPVSASEREQKAYAELGYFFREATGAELTAVTESQATYSKDAKLIVLGNCSALAAAANIKVDYAQIGMNGYVLKTDGSNLFISGGSQFGTLFGVYKFLNLAFGYEAYAPKVIALERGVTDRKMISVDAQVVPDIQQMMSQYGFLLNDAENALRMGYEYVNDIWILPNGAYWVHNFYQYVSPDIYKEEHPEWFINNQLCLSNEEMYTTAFLPEIKKILTENPNIPNISITHRDTQGWCTCKQCSDSKDKYGTDSAVMIQFINKVSRDVKAWLQENNVQRDITFVFFAYNATTQPPVKTNGDGTYSPIDESVVCEDNVAVFYAPISAKWTAALNEPENITYGNATKGWRAVCKNMFWWSYETNYKQYLVPFDTFNSMQANFRYYKENNVQMLFSQGQVDNRNSSVFSYLKAYLDSKLRWDVNADLEQLIDDYFKGYFGEGAEGMRKYFDDLRVWFDYQENVLDLDGGIYITTQTRQFWPKGVLDGFMRSIDEAIKAVEAVKSTDEARYTQLSDRIALESLAVRYLLEKVYSTEYAESELSQLRYGIKDDLVRLGISHVYEGALIESYYSGWNV